MARMGRPRVEISQDDFKKLCGMQCTLEEIAGFFNCSEDTVERWCKRELKCSFADAFKKYSAVGKASLRRTQWNHAKKSVPMAIFLGKQYLGQSDKVESTAKVTEEIRDDPLSETLKELAKGLKNADQ